MRVFDSIELELLFELGTSPLRRQGSIWVNMDAIQLFLDTNHAILDFFLL